MFSKKFFGFHTFEQEKKKEFVINGHFNSFYKIHLSECLGYNDTMPSDLKIQIQKNITIFKGIYRVLSEIEDLPTGTRYYAESTEDGKIFYLEAFYERPINDPEDFAVLEDAFFDYLDKCPSSCLKPLEIFLATVEGIADQFPVCVYSKPDGPTLQAIMKMDQDGCIETNRAFEIMTTLAQCLQELAQLDIFHGRLNTELILVSPQNELTLLFVPFLRDLHNLNFNPDSSQRFYAPPELFTNASEIDLSTEIYSFGCLLHEVLEGGPPFLEEDQQDAHLNEECPGLDGIPSRVHKLILRCLSKDRSKRPSDFQEIIKLLSKYTGGHGQGKVFKKMTGLVLLLAVVGGAYYGYDVYQKNELKKRKKIELAKRKAQEELIRQEAEKQRQAEEEKAELERRRIEEARKNRIAAAKKEEEKKLFIPPSLPGMVFYKESNFSMGDVRCYEDCNHVHQVELSAFYLDETEVSNEEFKEFVAKTNSPSPYNTRAKYNLWNGDQVPEDILRQPVINVSWEMAFKYCEFRGKRLPSEAEWEFAARGSYGRLYPWGSDEPTPVLAQYDGMWNGAKTLYEARFFAPGKTPEGVFNLLGGVKEWTSDWYAKDYYKSSPSKDPQGPDSGTKKVVRGGSWEEIPEMSAYRDALDPQSRLEGVGFRCAKTLVRPD